MTLLIFNEKRDTLFSFSEAGFKALKDSEAIQTAKAAIEGKKKITFSKKAIFRPPIVPIKFQSASRQAIVLLQNENHLLGALVIACLRDCRCNAKEVEVVDLILNQAAGVIKRAVLHEEEIRDLEHRYKIVTGYGGIIGKDPKMQAIYRLIEDIAPTDATVLIQGESGTGKELVAHAIHRSSLRKNKPFMVINCSAYPNTLLENELFGHEKGAFTGAIRQKAGRFEQADGGTVFLDEIGEIPLSAQIKLLRVLQTKKFERIGGENTLTVDVRVLAATNKDLQQEVKDGNFREDLFYRINVIPVHLPLLRNRRNDIPLLIDHFLRKFTERNGKKYLEISAEAMRLLINYMWAGNVRELENSIEHAVLLAKNSKIEASDFPSSIHNLNTANRSKMPTLADQEKEFLMQILEKCNWNKKLAARNLSISRNTLYLKIKKYQIASPTFQ
jgi:two-component system response regulator HydG